MRNRLEVLNQVQPFIGKYFSDDYVKRNVLRMSNEEIETIQSDMEQEPQPQQDGSDQVEQ